MSLISKETLDAVKDKFFVLAFFDFLLLIFPGVAIIFVLDNDLFQKLDWIKLILLSGALTTPHVILNTFTLTSMSDISLKIPKNDRLFIGFSTGVIFSGIFIYAVITSHYLFGWSLRNGLIILSIIEIFYFFLVVLVTLNLTLKKMSKLYSEINNRPGADLSSENKL